MHLLSALLLIALQGPAPEQDPLARASELITQADAQYWFALEEADDLVALNKGLSLIEQSQGLLKKAPESTERRDLLARAEHLHTALYEQRTMGRDTIEGVFPIYRPLTLGLQSEIFVDSPWILSTTRAGATVSEVVGKTWSKYAQLDTVVRLNVRHDQDQPRATGGSSDALANELSYVLGANPRLHLRHDEMVRTALGPELYEAFGRGEREEEVNAALFDGFDASRVLILDVTDEGCLSPLWIARIDGVLYSESGREGTIRSRGMAQDRRDRLPYLVGITVALLIISLVLASASATRARWKDCKKAVLLFALGVISTSVTIHFLGNFLPRPESLAAEKLWGPLCLAAAIGWSSILFVGVLGAKLRSLGVDWLPAHGGRGWVPLGIGSSTPLAWAIFIETPIQDAALITAVLVLCFGASAKLQGIKPKKLPVASIFLAWIALIIQATRMIPSDDLLFVAWCWIVGLSCVGLIGLFMTRLTLGPLAAFALAVMAATVAFTTDVSLLAAPGLAALIVVADRRFTFSSAAASEESFKVDFEEHTLLERLSGIQKGGGGFAEWPGFAEVVTRAKAEAEDRGVVCIAFRGKTGEGKTRSSRELFHRLDVSAERRLTGHCRDPQSCPEPLAPFTDTLDRGIDKVQEASDLAFQELGSIVPGMSFISDVSGKDNHIKQAAQRVKKALEELQFSHKGKPVGLEFEAAEHIDEESLEALKVMVDLIRLDGLRGIVLLLNVRDECSDSTLKKIEGCGFEVHQITLNAQFTVQFLEDVVGMQQDLAEEMTSSSNNPEMPPLWTLEWISLVVENGLLDGDALGKITGPKDRSAWGEISKIMPTSMEAAANERLKGLAQHTLDLVTCGSLVGLEFSLDTLGAVFSDTDRVTLSRELRDAVEIGVLVDVEGKDGFYSFRSVVYRDCLKTKMRREDGTPTQDGSEQHKKLANHFNDAWAKHERPKDLYRAAAQARRAGDDYRERAAELCMKAAEVSFEQGDWYEGIKACKAVLQNSESSPEQELRAHLYRLRCEFYTSRPLESAHEALACIEGSAEVSPSLLAELRCEAALRLQDNGHNQDSIEHAEQVAADSEADAQTLLMAKHLFGRGLCRLGGRDRAKGFKTLKSQAAQVPEDALCRSEFAKLLNTLGEELAKDGNPEALDYFEQSLKLKKERKDLMGEAMTLGGMGRFYLYHEEREHLEQHQSSVLEWFERNLEISKQIGDPFGLKAMPTSIGMVHLKLGRHEESLPHLESGLKRAERLGDKVSQVIARRQLTEALLGCDRRDEAEQNHDALLSLQRDLPEWLAKMVEESASFLES